MDKRFNRIYLGFTACLFGFGALVGSINSLNTNGVQAANGVSLLAQADFYVEEYDTTYYAAVELDKNFVCNYNLPTLDIYDRTCLVGFTFSYSFVNEVFYVNGFEWFPQSFRNVYDEFVLEVYIRNSDDTNRYYPFSNGLVMSNGQSYQTDFGDYWESYIHFAVYVGTGDDYQSALDSQRNSREVSIAYSSGFGDGYGSGYSQGFSQGHSGGYTQGFNDGADSGGVDLWGLIGGVLSMPFTFIQQAFDVTLFAGTAHAFPVGTVIYSFFAIALLVAIIKLILGR